MAEAQSIKITFSSWSSSAVVHLPGSTDTVKATMPARKSQLFHINEAHITPDHMKMGGFRADAVCKLMCYGRLPRQGQAGGWWFSQWHCKSHKVKAPIAVGQWSLSILSMTRNGWGFVKFRLPYLKHHLKWCDTEDYEVNKWKIKFRIYGSWIISQETKRPVIVLCHNCSPSCGSQHSWSIGKIK